MNVEKSWKKILQSEFEKEYFKQLTNFVETAYREFPLQIFPPENQVFRAFEACPFDQVKVVILGQDPYPTKGHAHGLCFSCDQEVRPLPKSLSNIYKELMTDLGIEVPTNGDLSHWAEQGVLMLNATLTVQEGSPESHAGQGWERFTDAVIHALNEKRDGIVYMLWGSKAQQKAEKVDATRNYVLKAPHPSPLSAYRGFFGCKHFSRCNDYLKSQHCAPIKWG